MYTYSSSSLESFVDDSKLFLSFVVKEMEDAAKRLNEDLRRVATWCCSHSLLINPEKAKLLLMGTPQLLHVYTTGWLSRYITW